MFGKKKSPTFALEKTVEEVQETVDVNDAHEVCEEEEIPLQDIEQVVVPLTSLDKQLAAIREYHMIGYRHYESMPVGGNQVVLRFVKVGIYDLS